MKRAIKWGSLIFICGLIISGISYLGHKQPFDPMTPLEESQANHDVLTRKSFKKIDLTASSADVVIKQGQHYTVSYYGKKSHAVHAKVKNGTLKVTQTPVTHSKMFNFHIKNNVDDDRCVITIPKNTTISSLKSHVNNDLVINHVTAKKVALDSNSGDISVLNSEFDGGNVSTTSGDIAIRRSSLLNTKLSATSGDIELFRTSLTKGTASLSSGDFNANRLSITGHYTITNQSGDNTITKSAIDGAKLTNQSGKNKLKHQTSNGGSLKQNLDEPNVVYLRNASGDNTIKQDLIQT